MKTSPRKSKFVVYKSKGEWRWRLIASNGRIVADGGEGYKRIAGALNGIAHLIAKAAEAHIEVEE